MEHLNQTGYQVYTGAEGASAGKFWYHLGSYGTTIAVGSRFGGPTGFGVGMIAASGEMLYDGYKAWATLMSQYLVSLENGIKNGYVPGRR